MDTFFLNIILQLIEALVCFDFYNSIKTTDKKAKKIILIIIGYILMCLINISFNYNFVINAIVLTFFQFLFSKFLYKHKTIFSFVYALSFTCLVSITELCILEIISIFTNGQTNDFIDTPHLYIILIILSKSLLFVVLRIISSFINKYNTNGRIKFTGMIYPISLLLVLMDFGVISYYTSPTNQIRLLISISSVILSITIIITSILQQIESQKEQELLELKAFQQEQEINNTYYELLEHQNEELQVFAHDTKKHYRTLYGLAENPVKLKEYIEGIVTDLEETNQIGKTSNKLLDLIISKYNYICDKEGIFFEKNIHQSNLSFINDNDLTSIFNNLFDNAIEAAKSSKKKTILFSLNKVRNMLVIDITNSCDTPPIVKNHKLISTKKDSVLHGYGFKSICRSVKKYNGDIEWEYKPETKEFVVSIIFPVHSNSI